MRDEFFELFIGVGRGEILPYASYYLTGFLHERPLALVREDMGKLGIARAERAGEPEDHIAILMDIMANLIRGEFAADGVDEAGFFARHIEPWGERLLRRSRDRQGREILQGRRPCRQPVPVHRGGGREAAVMTRNTVMPDAKETTMSQETGKSRPFDRRSFFKALGAGAAVAATPAVVTPAAAVDPGKEETKARYRETDHVKNFYRVNRY